MSEKKNETVVVIGLGYVGLPLLLRAAEQGYRAIGFDTNKEKIAILKEKKSPIEDAFLEENIGRFPFEVTDDPKDIQEADIVLICVPTPVDDSYYPDLEPVIQASERIAENLKKGALVVLESTVNPGVSEEIVKPIFEKHGHIEGKDVYL
ncbi:MAG: NAD(P)-binding domain-containing protein, partial [Candidatus Moraniibacteriota bacterium]